MLRSYRVGRGAHHTGDPATHSTAARHRLAQGRLPRGRFSYRRAGHVQSRQRRGAVAFAAALENLELVECLVELAVEMAFVADDFLDVV